MKKESISTFKTILAGICIGSADIVPGISGGTVAFIIGIYEELLKSIATIDKEALRLFFKGSWGLFFQKVAWRFLLALLFGVSLAFIALASCITYLLHHELYRSFLYAAFFGLVIGSCFFCLKKIGRWTPLKWSSFLIGAFLAFFLSSQDLNFKKDEPCYRVPVASLIEKYALSFEKAYNFDPVKKELLDVPKSQVLVMHAKGFLGKDTEVYLSTPSASKIPEKDQSCGQKVGTLLEDGHFAFFDPWLIFCGQVAISAMLLPGISGSYLLTILGVYGVVLASLYDFIAGLRSLHFDFAAFVVLFNVSLGCFLGAVLFSRVASFFLQKHPEEMIASLVGFMIGALGTVWPFCSLKYEINPLRVLSGYELKPVGPFVPSLFSFDTLTVLAFILLGFFTVLAVEFFAQRIRTRATENN